MKVIVYYKEKPDELIPYTIVINKEVDLELLKESKDFWADSEDKKIAVRLLYLTK